MSLILIPKGNLAKSLISILKSPFLQGKWILFVLIKFFFVQLTVFSISSFRPFFKIYSAETFLRTFASDRSHMDLDIPRPPWSAISQTGMLESMHYRRIAEWKKKKPAIFYPIYFPQSGIETNLILIISYFFLVISLS